MDLTRRVTELIDEVLGARVVGVYLHGSATQAGLRPASDLDILVVVDRSLSAAQRRALVDGLLPVSGMEDGARPVELLVLDRAEISPWRYPPTADFLYGEWLRDALEKGMLPQPETMADLAPLLTMVRRDGRALVGPPPGDVLPEVPLEDVRRASAAAVPDLLDELEDDTRNVLLTLARVWTTLATGEIRAKDAAADWALERLPQEHRPALVHARDLYRESTYAQESWSDDLYARVHPHAMYVAERIEELRP